MTKKNKFLSNFFTWILFSGLFILLFFVTQKFSQSFHFVDEDDHLATAFYMNKGLKLYRDISSNHQPIVYFISGITQKIVNPTTLFFLVKRGREAVFIWAFIWVFLLTLRHGFKFIIYAIFFETTKFFILGNLLLSESLVIYPLIFILGETFLSVFKNYKVLNVLSYLVGFSSFLVCFTLLPAIPCVIILSIIYLIKTKNWKQFFLGFFLPTLFLFLLIPIKDYFKETIYNNLIYVLPSISQVREPFDYFQLLFFPLRSFFQGRSSILNQFIKLFTLLFLFNLIFVIKSKDLIKIKKFYWFMIFIGIILLNTRVLTPGEMFYFGGGFHLLPWYGCFIFFCILTFKLLIKKINKNIIFLAGGLLLAGSGLLFMNKNMPYFVKIDPVLEHNTNFLHYYLVGSAIKAVGDTTDRLAVFPDDTLIYWQSELNLTTSQLIYADWQYRIPKSKALVNKIFTENPPEFIYADFQRIGPAKYLPFLSKILSSDYWQVIKGGVAQNLFINKTKIKTITSDQWQTWDMLSFDKVPLDKIK